MPSTVEKSVEVLAPIRVVYDQWTQFEEFPKFMEGVIEVRQINDTTLHWKAEIAGHEEEWDAEIVEQVPESRIAWRSLGGTHNGGLVTFVPIEGGTRVTVRMTYEPEGWAEKAADFLGLVTTRIEGDMERFREFVESRGGPTGAWRGEIHEGRITKA